MEIEPGRSVERSRCAGSLTACRPVYGLAFERRACSPGPRLRCGSKEARAPGQGFWNQACPPRVFTSPLGGGAVHGSSDDRDLPAQGLAHGGGDQRGRVLAVLSASSACCMTLCLTLSGELSQHISRAVGLVVAAVLACTDCEQAVLRNTCGATVRFSPGVDVPKPSICPIC